MSDIKSKIPDLKELASMTSKLYHDIKTSVGQIIQDYKANRETPESKEEQQSPSAEQPTEVAKPSKKNKEET